MPADMSTENQNVAARLSRTARLTPSAPAIIEPARDFLGRTTRSYQLTTFEELDRQSTQIARGLLRFGLQPGMRVVLAVPFSGRFIQLTFALLKAGLVPILVDPGMGRKNLVACLEASAPDGFMAVPKAQAIRWFLRRRFPKALYNITVGRRLFWDGKTLQQIMSDGQADGELPTRTNDDDAAVVFTTGSTGPPKGVRYTHGIFNNQIDLIRERYHIHPGSRDLACFPLFGLFDAVMGVTAVIPDMDATRPADVNPENILRAVSDWDIDQSFGSPALWNTVTRWCLEKKQTLPTLRRVLSAGAPVPPRVLQAMRQITCHEAEIFTPYGATEALPIASIESREVLEETAAASAAGKGTCVGSRFSKIQWRVIEIVDGPLGDLAATRQLPPGTIGELMVTGPVVTREYVTRTDQNSLHKVRDGDQVWHRMGDVGYLDDQDRFWFCGRKAHRVVTAKGTLFTIPCEAIFNTHPAIYRSALVGIPDGQHQTPVLIVEPFAEHRPQAGESSQRLLDELRTLAQQHDHTQPIMDIRIYPTKLPVDIRHNSKIFREQLAVWAQSSSSSSTSDNISSNISRE